MKDSLTGSLPHSPIDRYLHKTHEPVLLPDSEPLPPLPEGRREQVHFFSAHFFTKLTEANNGKCATAFRVSSCARASVPGA